MGTRGEYGKSKGNGEAVLERNRRTAKGEEESEIEEGMRSKFHFLWRKNFVFYLLVSQSWRRDGKLPLFSFVFLVWMFERRCGGMFVFDQGVLFLREVSRR